MSIKRQNPAGPAKHTHYVSTSNGCVYLAMNPASNYEDQNPSDWRPATPDEVERYNAGDSAATVFEEIEFDVSGMVPTEPNGRIDMTPPPGNTVVDPYAVDHNYKFEAPPGPAVVAQVPAPVAVVPAPAPVAVAPAPAPVAVAPAPAPEPVDPVNVPVAPVSALPLE